MFHPQTKLVPALLLTMAIALGGEGQAMPRPNGSSAFAPPDLGAPDTTSAGGTRGDIFFSPTDLGSPDITQDGGTRQGGDIFFSPTDLGSPDITQDGGTRQGGDLNALPRTLQLLVPPVKTLPLTLNERPEFFAYVPAAPATAVKFTLYRHDLGTGLDEELVYEVEMPMPHGPGIMRFTLPPDGQLGLAPDTLYHWYVSLVMDREDASGNVVADSWVQRVNPESDYAQRFTTLSQALPPSSAYAQAGLWYEALAQQLQARQPEVAQIGPQGCQQNPEHDDWSTFLQSVQLCDVVAAPLVNE
ncbi:MAG: DUF928 domain-containing protein [Cyanobacteria bacterium P01_G01_bin.54]